MYNAKYMFRSSCSHIPTTISRPSIMTPLSRSVPASISVSIPIPTIPSPVSVSISAFVFRPVVPVARVVGMASLLGGTQPLAQ